ncbi:MAG TPA: hypothetical protein VGD61_20705 [Pyrinomonadaceae bacterium]
MKKIATQNRFRTTLAGCLFALVFSSCGDRNVSLFRLVPQASCAILSVDWSVTKKDDDFRRLFKAKELEASLQRLGISDESIRTVVVFTGVDSQTLSGLLLRGNFDPKDVQAQLKRYGWTEESLDGNKVYVRSPEYIALPSSRTLFVGTRDAALGVFRARSDAPESILSSPTYKRLNSGISTSDSKPVKAFLLIPQGTLDMADAALTATSFALSFFNLGGIGQLLKAANVARGFAFTLDQGSRERYPVELCVLMRDEESAAFISGSLNTMKGLSELAALDVRDQQEIREFRKMTITRKGEVLVVKMEMPANVLFPPPTP